MSSAAAEPFSFRCTIVFESGRMEDSYLLFFFQSNRFEIEFGAYFQPSKLLCCVSLPVSYGYDAITGSECKLVDSMVYYIFQQVRVLHAIKSKQI